jgi:hypothetical protein
MVLRATAKCNLANGYRRFDYDRTRHEKNGKTENGGTVPVITVKAYKKNGGTRPLIPNLGTRGDRVVSFTHRPLYPRQSNPGRSSMTERCGKRKLHRPCWDSNPVPSSLYSNH